MRDHCERVLAQLVMASRWTQVPIYLGMVLACVICAGKFVVALAQLAAALPHMTSDQLIIALLSLVDISLVANLLVTVTIGGYALFVSHVAIDAHPEQPQWLQHVDASGLKIKLMASLVSVSGVRLLEVFMDTANMGATSMAWQVGIHLTFVVTTVSLVLMDRSRGEARPA